MTEYNISGSIITISTEVENERYLLSATNEYIDSVGKKFDSWYSSQGSCYAIVRAADDMYSDSVEPLISKGIHILNAQGVYSLDEKAFYDKYVKNCVETIYFYETVMEMQEKSDTVDSRKNEEQMYRAARKAGRGKVSGGGFGLGGALKGMATAGMMNAATGMAHSAVNAVGNIGSSISASADKAEIFKQYRSLLKAALMKDLYNVRNAIRTALQKEAGIVCKYVTTSESDTAKAICKNYKLGRIPAERKKEQIVEALTLNPYSIEIYHSIWEDYGDENGELRKMATCFCVPLEQQIGEIAENYGNNLFTQNCSFYEEAFNKKAAAVRIEAQIKATLDDLIQYCKKQTISEDTISKIARCRQLLEEIDIEARTVRGITYDTRELAEDIRKDFDVFYRTLQERDIFEKGTYEYVKSVGYLTEEFKSVLESAFEEEYRLRTPEKIYENIDSAIKKSLCDEIVSSGWINIPNYSGSFSAKEPTIYTIIGHLADELILALFERSSKGKSGVLLTNRFLRIYAKGIFSNENLSYPIELIEKIECQDNDKYVVTLHNQNPISFSMKQKGMTEDEQIAFGNILNDLIRMINNLSTESRTQLFRIFKHTKVCKCGMFLLEYERVCPSCKRMIKDNGEFVDTQICSNCNSYVQMGKKFCPICGYFLGRSEYSNAVEPQNVQSEVFGKNDIINSNETITNIECPNCHNLVKVGKKFCSKCGTKIQ